MRLHELRDSIEEFANDLDAIDGGSGHDLRDILYALEELIRIEDKSRVIYFDITIRLKR